MKKLTSLTFITLLSINIAISEFSYAEKRDIKKKRVAILDFNAVNTSKTYANAVRNIFEVLLHKTKCVEILERNQMESILNEQGFQMSGCTDTSCAVEIGKLLSADMIVMGNINKMGAKYTITVKFVSVQKGAIRFAENVTAKDENEIEDTLKALSQNIANKIIGKSKVEGFSFNISLSGIYLYPIGAYGDIADSGLGGNINVSARNLFFNNSIFMFTTGFYLFTINSPLSKSLWMLPMSLNIGYSFALTRFLRIAPLVGFGCMMSIIKFDANGRDILFRYNYDLYYHFDPIATVRIVMDFTLTSRVNIFIAPTYTLLFEKSSINHFPGVEGGVTVRF